MHLVVLHLSCLGRLAHRLLLLLLVLTLQLPLLCCLYEAMLLASTVARCCNCWACRCMPSLLAPAACLHAGVVLLLALL